MNWSRILLGGLAAGVATNLTDFVMHGVIMAPAYGRYKEVFAQEPTNPAWFALVAISIGLTAALLFARTRGSWAAGWKGGLAFGFFAGLFAFFPPFYDPLVIDGFPYHLAWCWGGINLIDGLVAGAVLGAIIPAR